MICLVSFSSFSNIIPAFTCESAVGNLGSLSLGVNILSLSTFVAFIGNIPLLKAFRVNSGPS